VATQIASRKQKGRRLQNWVCEQLARIGGCSWGQEDDMEVQSRQMGQKGVDVILRGRAAEIFPFSFECMSGESFKLVEKVMQAKNNRKPGTDWIIVHRRKKFRTPIVMMDWQGFERLLNKLLDKT